MSARCSRCGVSLPIEPELPLGDAAECYGFVRDDGAGAFLWQCH